LATIAEVFVVLHEMVHIVNGELDEDVPAGDFERTSLETIEMRRKWLALDPINRERACDMLALDALVAAPLPDWDLAWCAIGVELALATQSMLEMATWWRRPSSHPPSRERFSFLEWYYKHTKSKELREASRRLFAAWWISPIGLADLFSQAGWLGPYSDSLSDALARRPDIFDLEDPDEQVRRFYDPTDTSDRYFRSPPAGLYKNLYMEMFPEPDDRWKDILRIVPRPEDAHDASDERQPDYFAYRPHDPQSYWAAMVGGWGIFVGAVLPKLHAAGLFRAGTSFTALADLIKSETSSDSLATVAALLVQLRAGVPLGMNLSDSVVEDVLRICELSAPQA
jgi:hypothetical protein